MINRTPTQQEGPVFPNIHALFDAMLPNLEWGPIWMRGRICRVLTASEHPGFMPGKGTTDAIFTVRQMQEKYECEGKKLCFYRFGKSI